GANWRREIEGALERARVAVLLVSPDYLGSDFIAEHQLTPLLEAAKRKGLTILWVAVRASSYDETEIRDYQPANDPSQPLSGLTVANQSRVLVSICKRIKAAALGESVP